MLTNLYELLIVILCFVGYAAATMFIIFIVFAILRFFLSFSSGVTIPNTPRRKLPSPVRKSYLILLRKIHRLKRHCHNMRKRKS